MKRILPLLLIVGCVSGGATPDVKPVVPPVITDSFNTALLADALAKQAELANQSPAFDASDLLDGILNKSSESGIPATFADSVRKACPVIGTKPSRDLKTEEVAAIRSVK